MLSTKSQSISPSPTLAIDAKAKQMKSQGIDVIGFGAGEPDFDTPEHIKEAAVIAIQQGFTKYTPVAGALDLQKAICEKLKRDNGLDYEPGQIVVSNGAKHSLSNVFAAILNPGDEVIIPAPFWVSYSEIVKLNDGIPVIVPTKEENNFKITVDELSTALTQKTKAVLINSPNNPTGQVYARKELEEIAKFAVANNLIVISDEIYEKLIYGECEHVSIASLGDDIKSLTIIVNGVSKTYSMTGWRIGYTACSMSIAKIMGSIQSHATSNPNSIAQKAAIAALQGPQDCVETMKAAFTERRNYMVKKISSIPGLSCIEPVGAFYVFMNVKGIISRCHNQQIIDSSDSFAALLLEHAKVAVVPGTGFGAPDYVRLSYALALNDIKTGMERIEAFISNLT